MKIKIEGNLVALANRRLVDKSFFFINLRGFVLRENLLSALFENYNSVKVFSKMCLY